MLSKKSVKLTILVSEIIYMVLELCISYLFSPYFGSSNNVWTGIIGVILLSGSVGNYVGGKLAEKKDKDFVPFLFLLTSIFIFLIGILSDYVCVTLSNAISNNSLASLLSSFVLLFPSSFCLGTLPPQLMTKEVCKDQKEIGKVYMISTIGGLLGTFVGGYVLIPSMGVNLIVFLCGFVSFLFGIGNLTKYWRPTLLSVMFGGFYLFLILSSSNRSQVYEDTLVFDSTYNRIVVMDTEDENGEKIRQMRMDAGFESGTYLEEEKRYNLLFPYLKSFDEVVDGTGERKHDLLMIGGAAYQFPKHVLAHYEDVNIDVVELDGKVTELAKEYFFLQDCIDEFDKNGTRLGLYTEDAKVYIKHCNKKYDIVYNDAFAGNEPVRTLTTLESVKEIDALLNDGGFYVLNIVGYKDIEKSKFLKAEAKTIKEVFPYVYISKCIESEDEKINYRLVASHYPLSLNTIELDFEDSLVLTDNYCPIEKLIK